MAAVNVNWCRGTFRDACKRKAFYVLVLKMFLVSDAILCLYVINYVIIGEILLIKVSLSFVHAAESWADTMHKLFRFQFGKILDISKSLFAFAEHLQQILLLHKKCFKSQLRK